MWKLKRRHQRRIQKNGTHNFNKLSGNSLMVNKAIRDRQKLLNCSSHSIYFCFSTIAPWRTVLFVFPIFLVIIRWQNTGVFYDFRHGPSSSPFQSVRRHAKKRDKTPLFYVLFSFCLLLRYGPLVCLVCLFYISPRFIDPNQCFAARTQTRIKKHSVHFRSAGCCNQISVYKKKITNQNHTHAKLNECENAKLDGPKDYY